MSSYTVPEYIGYPGTQKFDVKGDYEYFKRDMDRRFQVAHLAPRDIDASFAANLFKGEDAWDKYVIALDSNGIKISDELRELKVVVSSISTIGETFSNDFGQSDLLSGIQSYGSKYGDLAFAFGIDDFDAFLRDKAQNSEGILGGLWSGANFINETANSIINAVGGTAGNLMSTIKRTLTNPNNKIDFPNFWKSSGYQCQYELSITLYCYNVQDDAAYTSNILASYAALMQFVLPRSKEGDLYSWPFLMDFKIPGLVHLPFCYCSNVSVIKGGDNSDLSCAYRPNAVELKMTINPMYNVMYNITEKSNNNNNEVYRKERPTLLKELDVLAEKRTFNADATVAESNGENSVSSRLTSQQSTSTTVASQEAGRPSYNESVQEHIDNAATA